MEKLLSDIEISRSVVVASFLELEAAARSCMCPLAAMLFEDYDEINACLVQRIRFT